MSVDKNVTLEQYRNNKRGSVPLSLVLLCFCVLLHSKSNNRRIVPQEMDPDRNNVRVPDGNDSERPSVNKSKVEEFRSLFNDR